MTQSTRMFHIASIGVTDAFGVIRDHLVDMMQRQVGEGDDMDARQVGQFIAIGFQFDADVEFLRVQWSLIFRRADEFPDRDVDRDVDEVLIIERPLSANVAQGVLRLLGARQKMITRSVEQLVKSDEISELHALNLTQVCKVLGMSTTGIRNTGIFNDLGKTPLHSSKLVGHKKGEGTQAHWKFNQDEVDRIRSACFGIAAANGES